MGARRPTRPKRPLARRAARASMRTPDGGSTRDRVGRPIVNRLAHGKRRPMPTVIGIAGSLRRGSYNAALLRSAVELAPPGLSIEVASIRDVPLYDGDVEAEHGVPE